MLINGLGNEDIKLHKSFVARYLIETLIDYGKDIETI